MCLDLVGKKPSPPPPPPPPTVQMLSCLVVTLLRTAWMSPLLVKAQWCWNKRYWFCPLIVRCSPCLRLVVSIAVGGPQCVLLVSTRGVASPPLWPNTQRETRQGQISFYFPLFPFRSSYWSKSTIFHAWILGTTLVKYIAGVSLPRQIAPTIKGRMMEQGTTLVQYQPLGSLPNLFRVAISNPVVTSADVDFLVDEIERLGRDIPYPLWWYPLLTLMRLDRHHLPTIVISITHCDSSSYPV